MKKILILPFLTVLSLSANSTIEMYKSATCGCCTKWGEAMEKSGFKVNIHIEEDAIKLKSQNNIPLELSSCHTALVDGYVVEGHVPADEIKRLLELKPKDVIGISVPGMPLESPGMEQNSTPEIYDVVLLKKDGSVELFASYIANKRIR